MGATPAEARDEGRLGATATFGADVPAPPLHGRMLTIAAALLIVLIGAAVAVAIRAPSGSAIGFTGGAVAAGALLVGGGTLTQAALVRRRYIEAMLRWAATEPPREQLGGIVLALTATGAHREARAVLAVRGLSPTSTTPAPVAADLPAPAAVHGNAVAPARADGATSPWPAER